MIPRKKRLLLSIAIPAQIGVCSEGIGIYFFSRFFTLREFWTLDVPPYDPANHTVVYGFSIFYFLHAFCGSISRLYFIIEYAAVTLRISNFWKEDKETYQCGMKMLKVWKGLITCIYFLLISTTSFCLFKTACSAIAAKDATNLVSPYSITYVNTVRALFLVDTTLIITFFVCIIRIWCYFRTLKQFETNNCSMVIKGILGLAALVCQLCSIA